ncbi:hypothetical protein D3C71_2098940 [compost metagenome]
MFRQLAFRIVDDHRLGKGRAAICLESQVEFGLEGNADVSADADKGKCRDCG